ncbi:MAG: hypothetical protein QN163_01765 [Armatimonadota bacterium]|nr:hypothetical protein [Armatimonadota bacterium]MDR5696393.1 hypothetical protein [Armatimonadota bacterium]
MEGSDIPEHGTLAYAPEALAAGAGLYGERQTVGEREVRTVEGWVALGWFVLLFCAWVVLPTRLLRRAGRG